MLVEALIEQCMNQDELLCLTVNQEQRKHVSQMCRLLKYDSDNKVIVIYDVDHKQVYSYRINEIEDLQFSL